MNPSTNQLMFKWTSFLMNKLNYKINQKLPKIINKAINKVDKIAQRVSNQVHQLIVLIRNNSMNSN